MFQKLLNGTQSISTVTISAVTLSIISAVTRHGTRALFVFGNTRLALVPPKQHPPHIGFIHPQAESFGELKLHRDGTRSCYVADPAGNAVEVLALIGTS